MIYPFSMTILSFSLTKTTKSPTSIPRMSLALFTNVTLNMGDTLEVPSIFLLMSDPYLAALSKLLYFILLFLSQMTGESR